MRLRVFALLLPLALLGLSGCEGMGVSSSKPVVATAVVAPADPAALRLAAAAEKAASALDDIARVETVRGPAAPAEDFSGAPQELLQPVTLRWSGPIEQVARLLAARAGYRFITLGKAPATPIVINLDVFDKPLLKVLRDVGIQAGERADLKVDPAARQVEVMYRADDAADAKK